MNYSFPKEQNQTNEIQCFPGGNDMGTSKGVVRGAVATVTWVWVTKTNFNNPGRDDGDWPSMVVLKVLSGGFCTSIKDKTRLCIRWGNRKEKNWTILQSVWDKASLCSPGCPATCYVYQTSLEFSEICLPLLPECWNERDVSPCLAEIPCSLFLSFLLFFNK